MKCLMRRSRLMVSVFAVFLFLFFAAAASVIAPVYASVPSEERGMIPVKKDFSPSFRPSSGIPQFALLTPAVSTFTDWYRYSAEARTLYAVNDSNGGVAATVPAPSEIRRFSGPPDPNTSYRDSDRTGIAITFFFSRRTARYGPAGPQDGL